MLNELYDGTYKYIKYWGDVEYKHRDPSNSATDSTIFGYTRSKEYITINNTKEYTKTGNIFIKISNNIVTMQSNSDMLSNFKNPIYLKRGRYKLITECVSGSFINNGSYNPYSVLLYHDGQTTYTKGRNNEIRINDDYSYYEKVFNIPYDGDYHLVLALYANTIFTDYKLRIRFVGLTDVEDENKEKSGVNELTSINTISCNLIVGLEPEETINNDTVRGIKLQVPYKSTAYTDNIILYHSNYNMLEPTSGTNYKTKLSRASSYECSSFGTLGKILPQSMYHYRIVLRFSQVGTPNATIGGNINVNGTNVASSSSQVENIQPDKDYVFRQSLFLSESNIENLRNINFRSANSNNTVEFSECTFTILDYKDTYVPREIESFSITPPTDFYGGDINFINGTITSVYDSDGNLLETPITTQIDPIECKMFEFGNIFWSNVKISNDALINYNPTVTISYNKKVDSVNSNLYKLPIVNSWYRLLYDTNNNGFYTIAFGRTTAVAYVANVHPGQVLYINHYKGDSYQLLGLKKYQYSSNNKMLFLEPTNHNCTDIERDIVTEKIVVPDDVYFIMASYNTYFNTSSSPTNNTSKFGIFTDQKSYITNITPKFNLSDYTEVVYNQLYNGYRSTSTGNIQESTMTRAINSATFAPIGTELVIRVKYGSTISPYLKTGTNFNSTTHSIYPDNNTYTDFNYTYYHFKLDYPHYLIHIRALNGGPGNIDAIVSVEDKYYYYADIKIYIKYPSKIYNTRYASLIRTKGSSASNLRYFSIAHLTDIHGDMDSMHAIYDFCDSSNISCACITGDVVPYGPWHGFTSFDSIISQAKTKTVLALGNHDFGNNRNWTIGTSKLRVFEPLKDTLEMDPTDHLYYYRDINDLYYPDHTIRLISLYPYHNDSATTWYSYYEQEQMMWLCDVLLNTPENYHIFILRHHTHKHPIKIGEHDMFYDYSGDSGALIYLNMNRDPVEDIIDAYNLKTTINNTYTINLMNSQTTSYTLEYDFTNREKSEFVAYLCGHTHIDEVGYARSAQTNQLVLTSVCTIGYTGNSDYHSYASVASGRVYGDESQIALNVYACDWERHKIRIARVGNNMNSYSDNTLKIKTYDEIDIPNYNNITIIEPDTDEPDIGLEDTTGTMNDNNDNTTDNN